MSLNLQQSTQFTVRKLSLITIIGEIDIRGVYQELNIFDSMFMPCIRGNIMILDGVGLASKLSLNGSEFISIEITKGEENAISPTTFKKIFRIYRLSDRKNSNQNSEIYILHFISDEMVFSLQQKIKQSFVGAYSVIAKSVLDTYLKVKTPKLIETTKGIHKVIVPNLSPFDTMNWLAKRTVDDSNLPNFFFFENKYGYYFASLSNLIKANPITKINFEPKNTNISNNKEFYGARDMEVPGQFNLLDNISNGVYAGKLIGIDPILRKVNNFTLNYKDIYGRVAHLNPEPNFTGGQNKKGFDASQMYDSKVSLYAYGSDRGNSGFIKKNDIQTGKIIDDTHAYVFQRSAIITNLLQTTMHLNLPGDFGLTSGLTVNVEVPKRGTKDPNGNLKDNTLDGKYIITATRHMIKGDMHLSVIEVATDSTNKPFYNISPI